MNYVNIKPLACTIYFFYVMYFGKSKTYNGTSRGMHGGNKAK